MPNNVRGLYTARKKALTLFAAERCELAHIGGCGVLVLERHHKDEDPRNNDPSNVIVLCRSHHKLVHAGVIDLADPVMPTFYVEPNGKRRYHYKLARDHQRAKELKAERRRA